MNCGNYQNLISSFLDGELDPETWQAVEAHMEGCQDCLGVYEDFSRILDFCDESFAEETAPPNSHALWCRINNIVETEIPEVPVEEVTSQRPGWFARFWHNSLDLSAAQLASGIAAIALVSSLLTVVAFKNLSTPSDPVSGSESSPSIFDKVLGQLGVGETPVEKNHNRLKEQRAAIEYWKNRVEARRATWNSETKLVFDRNLSEIEKAVTEYTRLLNDNPEDAISNEMLDSALKEKMELLREFSEF